MTGSGQADMGHAHQSNQLQPLEADVTFLADDDVVVHRDAERFCDVDDRLRHLDIRMRGRRVAGRMVVQPNDGLRYRIDISSCLQSLGARRRGLAR